jgi:hypothetical protein
METRSARECIMFEPTQLLRKWPEERPSNNYDRDSNVAEGDRRV